MLMNFNAFWLKFITLKSWRSNVGLILKVLRVTKHLELWIKIEASDFVIDTNRNGYVIPILNPPNGMFIKNNKTALKKL